VHAPALPWRPDRVEAEVESDEAGMLIVRELDDPGLGRGWAGAGSPKPIASRLASCAPMSCLAACV
jgi:hypothetical protein